MGKEIDTEIFSEEALFGLRTKSIDTSQTKVVLLNYSRERKA